MFNTLRYAKELEDVGLSRAQAEKHMEIIVELLDTKLATKDDIVRLEKATKDDIARLEKATKANLLEVKNELEQKLLVMENRLTLRLGGITAFALTFGLTLSTVIFKFM